MDRRGVALVMETLLIPLDAILSTVIIILIVFQPCSTGNNLSEKIWFVIYMGRNNINKNENTNAVLISHFVYFTCDFRTHIIFYAAFFHK